MSGRSSNGMSKCTPSFRHVPSVRILFSNVAHLNDVHISVVSAIAAFIVMPFLSFYLKMHDAAVGILASCSKIVNLLITSVAWNGEDVHMYSTD